MGHVLMSGIRNGKTQLMLDHIDRALSAIPPAPNVLVVGAQPFRSIALHRERKSTKMWMRMMRTGNYDPRKWKRIMRLVRQGQ